MGLNESVSEDETTRGERRPTPNAKRKNEGKSKKMNACEQEGIKAHACWATLGGFSFFFSFSCPVIKNIAESSF